MSALYGSIAPFSSRLSSRLHSHLHSVWRMFFLGRRSFGGVRTRLRSRVIFFTGVGGGGGTIFFVGVGGSGGTGGVLAP